MCGLTITYHDECGHTTYDPHTCAQSPLLYSPCTQPGVQPYTCPYNTTGSSSRYHPCPACLSWASLAERNRLEREELMWEQEMARLRERQQSLRRSTMWQSQHHPGLRASSPAPQGVGPPGFPQRSSSAQSISRRPAVRARGTWTPPLWGSEERGRLMSTQTTWGGRPGRLDSVLTQRQWSPQWA